ncbi:MAG: hypothetical protein AAF471_02735 [Myxococcota bacterium]
MFSPACYNTRHPVAQRLHRALARDRLGQTLLLVDGDEACASAEQAVLGLTQALLCKSPRPDCLALGCGTCNSCRRIAKQCHPNVHKVESPQASTASETAVGIDRIRDMHHQHHLSAYEPGPAVWIVPRAELLTGQAAAGLLKLLEEPKQQRFVFLIAPHAGALPAPVVSRCQKLFFPAMPPDEPTRMEQRPDEGTSVDCVSDLVGLIERTPRLRRLELAGRFPEGRDAVIAILRALQRYVLSALKHRIARQGDTSESRLPQIPQMQGDPSPVSRCHSGRTQDDSGTNEYSESVFNEAETSAAVLRQSEVWQGCARLEALQHAMDLIRGNGNRKLVVEELLLRAWP